MLPFALSLSLSHEQSHSLELAVAVHTSAVAWLLGRSRTLTLLEQY